jgi:hypothetical protein
MTQRPVKFSGVEERKQQPKSKRTETPVQEWGGIKTMQQEQRRM